MVNLNGDIGRLQCLTCVKGDFTGLPRTPHVRDIYGMVRLALLMPVQVSRERWQALTPEQKGTFATICPDFVVELRSSSDSLKSLQAKMREYIDNGALLGWLIDSQQRRVEIYRSSKNVEMLESPAELSGEAMLVGFGLNLGRVWNEKYSCVVMRTLLLSNKGPRSETRGMPAPVFLMRSNVSTKDFLSVFSGEDSLDWVRRQTAVKLQATLPLIY